MAHSGGAPARHTTGVLIYVAWGCRLKTLKVACSRINLDNDKMA